MHLCVPLRRKRWLAFASAFFLASAISTFAHDPGLSSANLTFTERTLHLQLTYNERDLAGVVGATIEELKSGSAEARRKLDSAARRAVVLQTNRQPLSPSSSSTRTDDNNNVDFLYSFSLPAKIGEIAFESVLLKEMAFGHRQAFTAAGDDGNEVARRILNARENAAHFSVRDPQTPESSDQGSRFLEFFLLGIRHIVTGYDHLLFLLGLLVVCRTPRSALLLITCFTVAHSLTLALSTFGLVVVPSRFVEATIAASIVYVGIENIIRHDGVLRGRWLLTFLFGLVHGLGFASVLREMGIAKSGSAAIVPLLAFNSGVEVGQLAIAALILPILWQLRRQPAFLRVGVPACSVLVATAGAYWLLERTVLS